MTDENHLSITIPQETSPNSSPRSNNTSGNGSGGRTRSDSQRSQRSTERPREFPIIDRGYRPSIRLRRSSQNVQQTAGIRAQDFQPGSNNGTVVGRRVERNRSSSEPQSVGDAANAHHNVNTGASHMPGVTEEITSPTTGRLENGIPNEPMELDAGPGSQPGGSNWRQLRRARTNIRVEENRNSFDEDEYESNLVDILDIVDPEVATLSTLTNLQNSLFVPDLGKYLNRRPTYTLTRRQSDVEEGESSSSSEVGDKPRPKPTGRMTMQRTYTGAKINTISSRVNDKYYAVLPHGTSLPGWTEEEKLELNDHVRHMLHSKRSKFKRSMKGFQQYVKKPLGFFVTVYATLITLFGLAWVLFLIGWVNVGGKQLYVINIIDNIMVALFAIIGDGLAPFRAVDTYHMIFIAHYHYLTWRLRKEQALPKLANKNDLPAIQPVDIPEEVVEEKVEFSVLNENQQKKLAHHQKKFAKSHSFYKPHETSTHHAFPLRLLVAVTVLLDCHSLLQIALGTCTWSISYHVRPFALTTVILCCSITCNITAGVLISIGDHKTRKKDVFERMERQELTAHAMRKVEKRRLGTAGGERTDETNTPIAVAGRLFEPISSQREKEEEAMRVEREMEPTPAAAEAGYFESTHPTVNAGETGELGQGGSRM